MRLLPLLLLLLSGTACKPPIEQSPLNKLLKQDEMLSKIANDPTYKVQIIYTEIQRDSLGKPNFQSFSHNTGTNKYFYPASTVKLPVALLAIERINELAVPNLSIHSPMITLAGTVPQTEASRDTTKEDSLPSIAHYIKKIFLVSDNDAYNRLYEFLGQGYINRKLREKGFSNCRIIHRLSVGGFDTLGNRLANPMYFLHQGKQIYQLPERYSNGYQDLGLTEQVQGKSLSEPWRTDRKAL